MRFSIHKKRNRIGPLGQKVLLLLGAGAALALTSRPDNYFRIVKLANKKWGKINQRNLRKTISKLYQSKMLCYKDNRDGTTEITLAENGKKRVLRYNLDTIKIKKSAKWDGLWRIIIFDIPEHKKLARDTLSLKLKQFGMLPLQKSVFISPYECKNEVDFTTELFDIKPYVRFILAKDVDNAFDLKQKFNLA